MTTIAVAYTTDTLAATAKKLAKALQLPLHTQHTSYDYLLLCTPDYIGLQKAGAQKPFFIDFLSNKLHHRLSQASFSKELLARAIGIKPSKEPQIIDATAGLLRDSFILAALGFHITSIERSPVLHCLIQDAIERGLQDNAITPILKRITLHCTDAMTYLKTVKHADVIYLDPMFPERKKSALVKKEMQILQDLLGHEDNGGELLNLALSCAAKRVVVKRPRLSEYLNAKKPNFSLTGKNSRFDIYLV